MATVPKSFIQNHIAQRRGSKPAPAAPAPAQQPQPKVMPKGRGYHPRPKKKKGGGFVRGALAAVAGEVLKGTGFVGRHIVKSIREDAMGAGGVPTNCASSPAISGLGAPGSDEPGKKKKNKAPLLTYKTFKRTKGLK